MKCCLDVYKVLSIAFAIPKERYSCGAAPTHLILLQGEKLIWDAKIYRTWHDTYDIYISQTSILLLRNT